MKTKFNLGDKVRIKSNNKVGYVDTIYVSYPSDGTAKESCRISVLELHDLVYPDFGISDYTGYKNNYSIVEEKDLEYLEHFFVKTSSPEELDEWAKNNPPKTIVCECGKETHDFAEHSNWCPKYSV